MKPCALLLEHDGKLVNSSDRAPITLSTLSGSETAKKLGKTNSQNFAKNDPKDKRVAEGPRAEAAGDLQGAAEDDFEHGAGVVVDDEEDVDDRGMRDAVPEGDPPSLFAGEAIGPGMVEKVTVAHRWKNVRDGEVPRWRCEMITDQKMVGELWVKYKDNEQPQDGEGDERSKHEVRKEKKRLSEQKRRQDLKQRRQLGGFNHAPSREKAGTIRINKESVQEYEKQQKMDERFSSRGHRVNKRRRHNNPLTELQSKFAPVIKSLLKDEKSLALPHSGRPEAQSGLQGKGKGPDRSQHHPSALRRVPLQIEEAFS